MSVRTIRAVVAVDSAVDRPAVQALLPEDVEYVGALDVYDGSWAMLEETQADVLIVACVEGAEQVPAFVEGAVRQRPARPVVVLLAGSAHGYVRRLLDAGADDVLTMGGATAPPDVLFTLEKSLARHRGDTIASPSSGRMICVVGPKGGTGKTVTACNLAVALADAGRRVTLVDLDLEFGDVGLTMGVEPERTIFDLAKSGGALDPEKLAAYLMTDAHGVRVLLSPTHPEQARAITPEFLRNVYGALRSMSDFVVVDAPAGLDGTVVQAVDLSSDTCVVGMLDALSLKSTKLGLDALERMGQDPRHLRLVLNRADSKVGITTGDAARILGHRPDVLVPSHRDVAVSVNEGNPVVASHPRSDAAKAFASLSRLYAGDGAGKARARTATAPAPSRVGLLRLSRTRSA